MNKLYSKTNALKMLSLVFAILLWFYVITEQNPIVTKDIEIPVRLVNVESLASSNMIMVDDQNSFSVSIRIKGKKDILDKMNNRSISASADLRGYKTKGDNLIPVDIAGIPSGIDIIKYGDNIKVRLEQYISMQLPVTIHVTGNPTQGFAVLNPLSNPTEISIKGAESLVNSVKSAVADLDISNASNEIKKKVPIKLLNAEGKEVLKVEAYPNVAEINVPIESIKLVPLQLDIEGAPSVGFIVNATSITPNEIYVTGKKEILDNLSVILTEKVNINNASASITRPINLILPAGVELVNKSEIVNVNIIIEKIIEKSISMNNIEVRNVPDNLDIEAFDGTITATIRGSESAVNDATNTLVFFIDLKDKSEGIHTVNINYEKPINIDILSITPSQQSIVLKPKA